MFRIAIRPRAAEQIRRLRRVDAMAILDAIESHLRDEPERVSRSRIKRLRGRPDATYRLRVGEYRVFYDVLERQVVVTAVLHKWDTARFYREEPR
ncbi:MAG TPA: type II toxin-antitoxin system RelE/ParE family toxin [Methylomirabilota bacterium]|jgi:mRNA-degrading endonuclease RelE of RelBE toxin-antitoxin system|nr:type II toxin-antitoxin system RelE/ParE family toxin [Methylomirabilota bacterium]